MCLKIRTKKGGTNMVSVNLSSLPIVLDMIKRNDDLNIHVIKLENGATVLDCGVNATGSFEA